MAIQHPETQLTEDEEGQEDEEELMPDLYVEKTSRTIFEVKFFDKFVLCRPATPAFYLAIRKIPLMKFIEEFEEFAGDREAARAMLRGEQPEFMID